MTITVLVPTVGRMEYLPATKKSLDAQTRTDFRVVVLDNASPADAKDFIEDWAKTDSRVEILRVEERVPMFSNFNRGMRAVKTPLVTFFHDDDVYLPRYLEVLAGALEENPRAAFSGSNFDFIGIDGSLLERRRWIKKTELWSGPRYVNELVGRGRNPVPMPGLVFRRDAFPEDGFDETLPIHFGDFVLLMRAAEERGMLAVEEPVVQIRKHAAQASLSMGLSKGITLRTELLLAYLDEYGGRHPEARDLVTRLRRRVALGHQTGLFWGWVQSDDASERVACVDALGDRALAGALRWVEARGVRPQGMGRKLGHVARRAAEALRL